MKNKIFHPHERLRTRVIFIIGLKVSVGDQSGSPANRNFEPMLVWCWATVCDAGPTWNQHWLNMSCLLGEVELRGRFITGFLVIDTWLPGWHKPLDKHCINVEPTSVTLDQHWGNVACNRCSVGDNMVDCGVQEVVLTATSFCENSSECHINMCKGRGGGGGGMRMTT